LRAVAARRSEAPGRRLARGRGGVRLEGNLPRVRFPPPPL